MRKEEEGVTQDMAIDGLIEIRDEMIAKGDKREHLINLALYCVDFVDFAKLKKHLKETGASNSNS